MTTITLIGQLGADPELRFLPNGTPVMNFDIATTKRVFNKQANAWEDGPTSWRRVTVWRGLAEGLVDQLTKGKKVIVIGEEQVRQYETANGDKGTSIEVTAEHVGLYLFPKKAGGRSQAQGWDTAQPPQEPAGGPEPRSEYSDAFDAQYGAEVPV